MEDGLREGHWHNYVINKERYYRAYGMGFLDWPGVHGRKVHLSGLAMPFCFLNILLQYIVICGILFV